MFQVEITRSYNDSIMVINYVGVIISAIAGNLNNANV